jgi:hypothetical protein
MLKKPCPYHKTPVNHTLEQCDMLKKYYSRAATKVLTPKFGKESDLWVQLGEESVRWKEGFFRCIRQKIRSRLSASVRQENS